jgi:molybdopterin-containing oxidoreductase family iron-sulfur binding subunit
VLPGTADDVSSVHFGYGRQRSGPRRHGVGHDTFRLRTSRAPWFDGGARGPRTGERISSSRRRTTSRWRAAIRSASWTSKSTEEPKAVEQLGPKPPPALSLYPPREYNGHKWGMAIDLNACTGCGVCVAAVRRREQHPGRRQVAGRAQPRDALDPRRHLLRGIAGLARRARITSRCRASSARTRRAKSVCPVAATVHSDEGLNDMVYNRCVGTRYCSNNCPYKGAPFNFLLYSDFTTPELMAQRNPDVTIRSRGVMEKCTYCVQRINHARIDAKTAGREIQDGEIKTACQQAVRPTRSCSATEPDSELVKLKQIATTAARRAGTRRGRVLAVVRNPNRSLARRRVMSGVPALITPKATFGPARYRPGTAIVITDKLVIVLTKNTPTAWFASRASPSLSDGLRWRHVPACKGIGIWGNNIPVGWASATSSTSSGGSASATPAR